MSLYVLKRLVAAQCDGSSMKIKVAKDIKNIEITLNGKDKFQFTKTPLEKLSKILLLAGNQMEIVGNIKHQVTSTKDSNSKAMKDLATKKMKTAYKEEKIKREQKKIQVIDPLPDPDVVKPKNQKTNRVKRKDVGVSYCVPASSSFISNDDTSSGVPLRKRVIHLIASTELDTDQLNTDQIVKKVKDSKENVQKVLDEVAEQTKKGTWKLTPSAWLILEPYTWFSYGQKVVSGVVQKMNEVADSLGLPQDSPQRPRQPKHNLPPNHSTNIDVGEPLFRKRLKIGSGSYSEILQNNDISLSGSFRGTKSTRGKVPKKRAAKTLTNLQKHDDDIELDPKNIPSTRSTKSVRSRSSKTTTNTNSSITADPVTSHTNPTRAKRGRPVGSKTSRLKTSSKVATALSNVAPSKQETNESNGHPSINGVNNETKQSQYRVNTLSEFRELIDEFKAKQDEYNELDEKLQGWLSLYKELDLSLRSARQSREKPIINRIMETFGSGSEIFALVEQFNAIEEELCQISTEAWRAAKEGILDE